MEIGRLLCEQCKKDNQQVADSIREVKWILEDEILEMKKYIKMIINNLNKKS